MVTPDIVSMVRHIPRVAHLDYPGCDHLRTVSKDELMSLFCKTPSSWGDRQNTRCLTFAKGPRFLNMVMTFILHPLSHYNTITKPRAGFLIPLIEDLSIDFLSYLIFSLIDVFKDTVTRNKLIFPLAITRIFHHFSVSFPPFDHFFVMGAIDAATVRRNDAQLRSRRMQIETVALLAPTAPSTFAPSSFAGGVTLEAIMAQLVHMDSCL